MQVNEAIKEIALKIINQQQEIYFYMTGLTQNLDKIKLIKNYQCQVCSN